LHSRPALVLHYKLAVNLSLSKPTGILSLQARLLAASAFDVHQPGQSRLQLGKAAALLLKCQIVRNHCQ
jgi:hypothetical protein